MRLYRDVKASQRRQLVRNSRGWEIGMEVAGGWHSGFVQSSDPLSFGGDQASGTDAEACFTAHGGPGFSRLGLCVVGLGYQSQHDARGILWIYTEPRLRLLGRVRPGESSWELGALFRFGLGMISRSPDTPTILGPGVYVARNLRHAPGASRWMLQASYSHATFRGFSRPIGSSEKRNPASDRLTLGIGWYR
jgi:hypothetical protein